MEEPDGAVHKPTIDYYRHPAGAILPLPVREKEVADRQREVYLQKKAEDKEAEQQEKQLIADDTEESAYDPDANPYDGIPYRNGKNGSYMKPSYNNASDFDFWFGGIADASPTTEFSTTKKRKNETAPEPQQPDKQQKTGNTFQGKVKRIPGSLGRVFEPMQFHINMAKPDYTFVFYGRRRSGKSYLMRYLL